MRTKKGFTLIELIIAIAVIGILLAIGLPAYTDHVKRGKLAEGISALSDGRVKMEQFFQDNRTYFGGPCPAATANFTYACAGAPDPAAAITVPPTPPTYTITATGIGSLEGFVYTIDETNTKRTTSAPAGWATPAMPAPCWISKKGGAC